VVTRFNDCIPGLVVLVVLLRPVRQYRLALRDVEMAGQMSRFVFNHCNNQRARDENGKSDLRFML
jgi:hypothetical protein